MHIVVIDVQKFPSLFIDKGCSSLDALAVFLQHADLERRAYPPRCRDGAIFEDDVLASIVDLCARSGHTLQSVRVDDETATRQVQSVLAQLQTRARPVAYILTFCAWDEAHCLASTGGGDDRHRADADASVTDEQVARRLRLCWDRLRVIDSQLANLFEFIVRSNNINSYVFSSEPVAIGARVDHDGTDPYEVNTRSFALMRRAGQTTTHRSSLPYSLADLPVRVAIDANLRPLPDASLCQTGVHGSVAIRGVCSGLTPTPPRSLVVTTPPAFFRLVSHRHGRLFSLVLIFDAATHSLPSSLLGPLSSFASRNNILVRAYDLTTDPSELHNLVHEDWVRGETAHWLKRTLDGAVSTARLWLREMASRGAPARRDGPLVGARPHARAPRPPPESPPTDHAPPTKAQTDHPPPTDAPTDHPPPTDALDDHPADDDHRADDHPADALTNRPPSAFSYPEDRSGASANGDKTSSTRDAEQNRQHRLIDGSRGGQKKLTDRHGATLQHARKKQQAKQQATLSHQRGAVASREMSRTRQKELR